MNPCQKLRRPIAAKVRALRLERRWTQRRLAGELGISQSRLSEIESGAGSFSAEQFLRVLELFNVTSEQFAPRRSTVDTQLQNALARLGATHLIESDDVIPTEKLHEAAAVVREVLAAPENPRQVAALAPVIVNNIQGLSLRGLRDSLASVGHERRLYWLLENVLEALREETARDLPRRVALPYKRAALMIDFFLKPWLIAGPGLNSPLDILDSDIISPATTEAEIQSAAGPAKRWNIVTRLDVGDFVEALRQARESS
ncbi:MAG: helix-turn-helix transcriptional regulator [Elusimicrobia bacterium]|nr:helix-turn-helix transcriptional regulator [Elusimicrobiota bacterium]